MLVTFESKVGRITMVGDTAVQLLRLMGHSGTIPSALLAADIPAALAALAQGLAALDAMPAEAGADERGHGETPEPISLRTRAYPLIQLLEDSAKHSADLLWAQGSSAPLQF
jgi:hypothetical protein